MALSTIAVFDDGPQRVVGEGYRDLGAAVEHAIDLADRFGSQAGDAGIPPQWVRVMRDGTISLTLRIVRGGLTARASR